jgi:putative tryptophan/tyrosine transport system substrate-binding protein
VEVWQLEDAPGDAPIQNNSGLPQGLADPDIGRLYGAANRLREQSLCGIVLGRKARDEAAMPDLRRRDFIVLLGGFAACPRVASAQPSGKPYRIGFLGGTSYAEYGRLVDALRMGLRQLGYEEGRNIIIEYRWADGRYNRLTDLAGEFVNLNVNVIVAPSTPVAQAAKQATSTIPIVAISGDPVAFGLASSLARPGGNLTGLTFFFTEVCAKRVEMIKEAIPSLTRVAVLVNPANPATFMPLAAMQRTASALRAELVPVEVTARDDVGAAVTMVAQQAQALVAIEDPLITSNARKIADFALQNKVPLIGFRPQAEAGALMEYGVDLADLFSRSASFVDKILKGTAPADLPIERAVKFEVIVNLKSARLLGIELPTSLLLRANEVIE